MKYEFATPEPPKIHVGLAAGHVEIETAEPGETVVEVEAVRGDVDGLRVEQHGREIVVEHRKRFALSRTDEYDVRIRTPHGADADLNVGSAAVRTSGRLGGVEANTASGNVEIDHVERDVRVRSASGNVRLTSVGGKAVVYTASGDVRVAEAGAGARIKTASGDQTIGSVVEGKVDLKSASGDVSVGIRRGSRVHVDARSMSGETTSEVELFGAETTNEGPLVELNAATMSGDIRVVRS